MTSNRYAPHVLVIPEDDANRQIASGFKLGVTHNRQIEIVKQVGGWRHVPDIVLSEHLIGLRNYPFRHVVLLLDFDDKGDRRREEVYEVLGDAVHEFTQRIFLLGAKVDPETLKRAGLGTYEEIGRSLADE